MLSKTGAIFRLQKGCLLIALFACAAAFGQSPSPPVYGYTLSATFLNSNPSYDIGCVSSTANPTLESAITQKLQETVNLFTYQGCAVADSMQQQGTVTSFPGPPEDITATGSQTGNGGNLSASVQNGALTVCVGCGEFSASDAYFAQENISAQANSQVNLTFRVTSAIDDHGGLSYAAVYAFTQNSLAASARTTLPLSSGTQALTLQFTVGNPGNYSLLMIVSGIINNGSGSSETVSIGGCAISVAVHGNGTQAMTATATPIGGATLQATAAACGYEGFDWVQSVTTIPCPGSIYAANPQALPAANFCPQNSATPGGLTAGGTAPPFNDSPPGGYTYAKNPDGSVYNPYPFYFYPSVATVAGGVAMAVIGNEPESLVVVNGADTALMFYDAPEDPCLPTGPLTLDEQATLAVRRAEHCGGSYSTAPPGSFLGFTTSLVGLISNLLGPPTASAPLFSWTWTDTYNGQVGSITSGAGLNFGEPIPNTGAGYITVTSLNGVPVPPIVPATAVTITASGLAYSRVTQTFNGTVTISNVSDASIATPTHFQVVFNGLPSTVTLANSAGTFNEAPYITVPNLTSLAPGQTVTVQIRFTNPSNKAINFTPEFYAGSFQ